MRDTGAGCCRRGDVATEDDRGIEEGKLFWQLRLLLLGARRFLAPGELGLEESVGRSLLPGGIPEITEQLAGLEQLASRKALPSSPFSPSPVSLPSFSNW